MSPAAKRRIVFALVGLVILVGGLTVQIPLGPSVSELRSQLTQALPIGSSPGQVTEFVRKAGMGQGIYLERERMINAMVRGISKGLIMETSLYVRFYFDGKGGLESFTVEEVSTGL